MAELTGIEVKVSAEVADAIAKLRAVRDEIKSLHDRTVKLTLKENFEKAKPAIASVTKEVKKLGSETNTTGSSFRRLFADVKKGVEDSHGGVFSKILGGGKGWFKNIAHALGDVWTAAKNVGGALSSVIQVIAGGISTGEAFAQAMAQTEGAIATLLAESVAAAPALLALGAAITVVVAASAAIGAGLSGLIAATGALAAGAIGVGVLVAVAMPAIQSLRTGLSALSTATKNYSDASKTFNIGLKNSKQDMAQYKGVLSGVDGNLRGAVKLLRDSHVQWANLSQSQRRSVVALSENKAALKGMSPAMSAALTALMKQRDVWNNLTPAQQRFSKSLSAVSREWHAVQRAAQPVITLLLNDLAKLAKDVIPMLVPVINATGQAIHKLLVRADTFVKSEKFKAWVHNLTREIPGVIAQVGNFISKLAGLIGPIITNKKNLKDLHNTLQTVWWITKSVVDTINRLSEVFSHVTSAGSKVLGFLGHLNNALNDIFSAAGAAAGAINSVMSAGASGGLGAVLGKVLGFETGTPGAPPGFAWTGERGPELVKFNGGETVIPHGPSMAMARGGYANGTPGWSAGAMPPIIVNVDGRQLFKIMQGRTLSYNVANNGRAPGGSARGVLAN